MEAAGIRARRSLRLRHKTAEAQGMLHAYELAGNLAAWRVRTGAPASRRRCGSVNPSRRPASCAVSARFSSRTKVIT